MLPVLAVVTDLFFQVRVRAAAAAAGCPVQFVTDPSTFESLEARSMILVDLDARLDVIDAIRRLKGAGMEPVIAFGPHLDTTGRKAARAAGADRVLAKSKFVTELPRIMTEYRRANTPVSPR